jgi:RIO-like serine/threonine protein kinase
LSWNFSKTVVHGAKASDNVRTQLQQFLEIFDRENLVHGDLRPPKILLCGEKVRVIDFNWAGTHNSDKYPEAMNPTVTWADGVQVAQTMLKEHDRYMVESLLRGAD